jgi:peroxiredoxin Q/BCP
MLKQGSNAPEFILPDEEGNEVSLSNLLQVSPIILYFYPADFTTGCTREACAFRDIHEDVKSVGLQTIGISPQSGKSHLRFKREHNLPFTLLSDPEKVAIKMYDADGPLGFGVRRITYLINQGMKVQGALQADILIDRHKDFVEKAIMLRETAGMKIKNADAES